MSDYPEAQVLVGVDAQGLGRIELNRPRVINALTRTMIDQISAALTQWAGDDHVTAVELTGSGTRGLCSGADVVALRAQLATDPEQVKDFLRAEYALNAQIAHYPKPLRAVMDGITMGGGMGLSVHAAQREATHTTRVAMPETIIGFFPDVGSLFWLSRMPGLTGLHLALTGASIEAASAFWGGLVDHTVELEVHPDDSELAVAQGWIDECYDQPSAADVLAALADHGVAQARSTAALIAQRSPLSVAVTFEAYHRAALATSVDEVLAQDLRLGCHFVDDSDFAEGVRAQLVDKDRTPHWRHAGLDDLTPDEVARYFAD